MDSIILHILFKAFIVENRVENICFKVIEKLFIFESIIYLTNNNNILFIELLINLVHISIFSL